MKQSPVLVLMVVFALMLVVGVGVLSGGETTRSTERMLENTPQVCLNYKNRVEAMIGPDRMVAFVTGLRQAYTLTEIEEICLQSDGQEDEDLRVFVGSVVSDP